MSTSPPSSGSADHHYIPKLYLKGFTDKNQTLWVYEQGSNAPRPSTPKKEGHRENYYQFTDKGYPDNSAELALGKIESLVAPTLRKLANPQFRMTDQQRNELCSFIAVMFVRVPAYRDFINDQAANMIKRFSQEQARDRDKFYALIKAYEERSGKSLACDLEGLRQFAAGGEYSVTQISAGFNLRHIFQSCLTISDILETEYSHDIFYAPADMAFVTCDNPIVTIEPDNDGQAWIGMGFGRPKTEVVFPLNKRATIILSRNGREEQVEASPKRAQQVNDMMMRAAQRFAYGSVGTRRLARVFNERGCKIKYGTNSFM